MSACAYYNEIDPYAAEWLRNLIARGCIAPGDVDDRSIEDVQPDDLRGYTQCHFFAGIGVWSYAARRAGWPDDRPVWTGSCPCQPFSAAGRSGGFADERHLWPHWFHLIGECRPDVVLGEQVASKDGLGWLDLVQADMEGAGYACGGIDTCSAGVGAPHIRQRLRFVAQRLADPECVGREVAVLECGDVRQEDGPRETDVLGGCGAPGVHSGRLGDSVGARLEGHGGHGDGSNQPGRQHADAGGSTAPAGSDGGVADAEGGKLSWVMQEPGGEPGIGSEGEPDRGCGDLSGLADAEREQRQRGRSSEAGGAPGSLERAERLRDAGGVGGGGRPSPTNGFWGDPDWLFCRDGKWRPVEPGSFPLAHGATARVGRLRAYGNAVDAEATRVFIEAVRDVLDDNHHH